MQISHTLTLHLILWQHLIKYAHKISQYIKDTLFYISQKLCRLLNPTPQKWLIHPLNQYRGYWQLGYGAHTYTWFLTFEDMARLTDQLTIDFLELIKTILVIQTDDTIKDSDINLCLTVLSAGLKSKDKPSFKRHITQTSDKHIIQLCQQLMTLSLPNK
jgi:hypothetical protein